MAMAPPPPPSHHCNPFSLHFHSHPQMQDPILSFSFIILFIIALSFTFLSFSVHKRSSKNPHNKHPQPGLTLNPENNDPEILSQFVDEAHRPAEDNPTRSLLHELLPSDSAKWATFFNDGGCDDPNPNSSDPGGKKKKRKEKKKRKGKKKKMNSAAEDDAQEKRGGDRETSGSEFGTRPESACLCPFTSSSSAMQRKIKQQYDELVKCNESKKLTLAQVVQFANSLVDARSELQHKADVIQRKFVITKALLCKAERSSFDRLRQQIYKLELEQKRLEEDASVYNWLQQQLKLSPAYKKMLEIGASMEKAKSCELGEKRDDEFADISFEELLAQEKKDSFWKKKGKSSLCSS